MSALRTEVFQFPPRLLHSAEYISWTQTCGWNGGYEKDYWLEEKM